MIIEVTQEDINAGRWNSCTQCPIALAINRATGHYSQVDIDGIRLYSDDGGDSGEIRLSRRALAFINRFDGQEDVAPFRFRLDWRAA